MKYLRGRHSIVYFKEKYVIKEFNKEFRKNFFKEVYFLNMLKDFGFVPKLVKYDKENLRIYMEKVDGIRIEDFLKEEKDSNRIKEVLRKILEICFFLDRNCIEKTEMSNPYKHIIINNNKVYFIDWERSYEKENPGNLTKFIQYIFSKKEILEKKGIKLCDFEELKDILREYKKEKNEKVFEKILKKLNLI